MTDEELKPCPFCGRRRGSLYPTRQAAEEAMRRE